MMNDSRLNKWNRQNDDSAVSKQETMKCKIKRKGITMKHRMSKTEEGGNALRALKESTEKGTQTLDMNGMNQL